MTKYGVRYEVRKARTLGVGRGNTQGSPQESRGIRNGQPRPLGRMRREGGGGGEAVTGKGNPDEGKSQVKEGQMNGGGRGVNGRGKVGR